MSFEERTIEIMKPEIIKSWAWICDQCKKELVMEDAGNLSWRWNETVLNSNWFIVEKKPSISHLCSKECLAEWVKEFIVPWSIFTNPVVLSEGIPND